MGWGPQHISNPSETAPNPIQNNKEQSDVNKFYNRAEAVRRDTDKVKNVNITLEDIDSTIIYHLQHNLKLQVNDNGETIEVPIIYGNPERWAAIKRDGYLRDNQGKILLPAFMIRRKNVENNKELMTFNRYLHYQTVMKYSEKNKYDRFDLINKTLFPSKPTQQIYNVTMPNHVIVSYECIIWTDYVDQNNKILEQINFANKDYWGDRERYKFRARVDSYSIEQEVNTGEDRNVKATFDLIVNGYLINDTIVDSMTGIKNTTQKSFTVRKIMVGENLIASAGELQAINSSTSNDSTALKQNPLDYVTDASGAQALKADVVTNDSGYNIIPNTYNSNRSMFRPAPKSPTDYGEDGWLAYDAKYIYVYKSSVGWLKRQMDTFDYDYSSHTYISGYDCNNNPIYTTQNKRPINTAFRIFARFPDKFYYQVPFESSDYGEDGWMSYDNTYFYIYSTGQWRRVPITLFT